MVAAPARTVEKNRSVVAFSAPSGAPVALEYVRMRPLAASRYCVGPTSPEASGSTRVGVGFGGEAVRQQRDVGAHDPEVERRGVGCRLGGRTVTFGVRAQRGMRRDQDGESSEGNTAPV